MFTDNPKRSIENEYCPHYDKDIESFSSHAGVCEGWQVWACTTCGYFYFTDIYYPEVLGPTTVFTLADALQAYNWALKGKDDEPPSTRAMLLRLLINYMGEHRVDREHALLSIRAVLHIIEQESEGE